MKSPQKNKSIQEKQKLNGIIKNLADNASVISVSDKY